MLAPLGFEVREAVDGGDAVARAQAFQPDAILMDVVMPEQNGLQATKQIRAMPELQDTVIIAISASAFMEDQKRSLAAGCDAFIAKPFQHALLLQVLQEHLDLTWIYETEAGTVPGGEPETVALPPYVELVELYKLALMGKIVDLRAMLATLVAGDSIYAPFVTEIGELAQNVRLKEMRRRLKEFLDSAEETA
jgi:CheY-like chemotaxis protein